VYDDVGRDAIAGTIEAAKNSGALALNVLASVFVYVHRQIIYERVAALSLPAASDWELADHDPWTVRGLTSIFPAL
jgi:hypothetical protein